MVVVVVVVVVVVEAQPDCLPTLVRVPHGQRSRSRTDRYLNTCPVTQIAT